MARPPSFIEAEERLREAALRFPEATEDHPWGHVAFKVKKKIFTIVGGDDHLTVSLKLPSSNRFALLLPWVEPTGYGLGKSGWVTATLVPADPIPIDRLLEWMEESYRAIAPKKLIAILDDGPAGPAPKRPARKPSARMRSP